MANAYLHQIRLVSLKFYTSSDVILKKYEYIALFKKYSIFQTTVWSFVPLVRYFIYSWYIWANLFLVYETTVPAV